jgi:hypothetical protein
MTGRKLQARGEAPNALFPNESFPRVARMMKKVEKSLNRSGEIFPKWTGTDVMILKIFSPKNLAKIFAYFAQTTVSFCKNCDHNIGFWEKRHFFRRKLAKIAENGDHNIDPRNQSYDFLKIFLRPMPSFLVSTHKHSIFKSFYTQQHCYVSLKTLDHGRIRTRVFLFLRRMRCPRRHTARAQSYDFCIFN